LESGQEPKQPEKAWRQFRNGLSRVRADPFHVSRLERIVEREERWQTLGSVGGVRVLLVVHTVQEIASGEPEIRIISARLANRQEREVYEEGL
jgi:uncharacterized protein